MLCLFSIFKFCEGFLLDGLLEVSFWLGNLTFLDVTAPRLSQLGSGPAPESSLVRKPFISRCDLSSAEPWASSSTYPAQES